LFIWDGGSSAYYTHNWSSITDFQVYSPQIEAMNWVFMLKEAERINPDFWFEISIWDGNFWGDRKYGPTPNKSSFYNDLHQSYSPARYAGYAQFGLWLLRPRVIREFRHSSDPLADFAPYFSALAEIVDRIYSDETLKHFWRHGELVANNKRLHPYQVGITSELLKEERWFLLDTNLHPPEPWTLDTEIPVYALALVDKDLHGQRRWLVYAHAPIENRRDVLITIPDYGQIKIDVNVAGSFYLIEEQGRVVKLIL